MFAEVAGFVVLASPRLRASEVNAIRAHLQNFATTSDEGKAFHSSSGFTGMRDLPPGLTESMDTCFIDAEGRSATRGPLVDAQDLRCAHTASPPALRGLDLRIEPGEPVLLQGPSGGGQSTLAALLTGLRRPQSGLLLQGLDARRSVINGAAWRPRHRSSTRTTCSRAPWRSIC
ncbi:MAG: ATP-binding cassette domain-containing protein [Pseudomonadota bacterium]|nr:ATP-binding cassette domain-containing protein [Pseudomonadota bacterium]